VTCVSASRAQYSAPTGHLGEMRECGKYTYARYKR
jgi:hypothetical protein